MLTSFNNRVHRFFFFTSSVERAAVSVVVALEVDDDVCVTTGNLPERQRRDSAPLIEGVDKRPPRGENSSQCTCINYYIFIIQQRTNLIVLNLNWFFFQLKLFCAGVKSQLAVLIFNNRYILYPLLWQNLNYKDLSWCICTRMVFI